MIKRRRTIVYGQSGAIAKVSAGILLFTSLGAAAAPQNSPESQGPLFTQHAIQAGVQACGSVYPKLGAMITEGATYTAATTWDPAAPDAHPVQGLAGIKIDTPGYSGPAAGVVFATPVSGGCAGNAVRVVPLAGDCAAAAKQLPAGSRFVRDLSGTLLYEIGNGQGQVMLMNGAETCIAISVNQIG